MDSFQSYIGGTPSCPICRVPADCHHFIGYAENGKLVERSPGRSPILTADDGGPLPSDVCVNTGVSTRVYRDWVFC